MISNQLKNAVDKWSNSFLRPLIPPKLLSNSEIIGTEDDGAKLIYLKFLYGIRTGRISERPTDGGVNNVIRDFNEESLWIYSLRNEEIPDGFKPLKKKDSGIIGTGDIRKCSTCRGQGRVRCKSCGGKVRWTSKDFEGNRVENVCSCGDGKQMCGSCDGFGEVEIIIRTEREFKLFDTKNSQYTGEVPETKIKKITGDLIYEQVYDYPLDMVREMLVGGIDAQEFDRLNNAVLDNLKQSIDNQLKERGDIDTDKIHVQMDKLFASLPNPGKENKVLEHESMPIRVMVRVENAPVKQIDYKYKDKNYSLWVYGKENSVWKQKAPISFNYKGIVLSILLLFLVVAGIFSYVDSNRGFSNKIRTTNNTLKENSNYDQNNYSNSEINKILVGLWKYDGQWGERNLKFSMESKLVMEYGRLQDSKFLKDRGNYGIKFGYTSNGIKGYYFQNMGSANEHPKINFTIKIIDENTIKEIRSNGYQQEYIKKGSNTKTNKLSYLNKYNGVYTKKNNVFESQYLGNRIEKLLGTNYSAFKKAYGFDVPLEIKNNYIFFETGASNGMHDQFRAFIYVDINKDLIYIAILNCDRIIEATDSNNLRINITKISDNYNKMKSLKKQNSEFGFCN